MNWRCDFNISGLYFCVESPKQLQVPEEFQVFQVEGTAEPDIRMQISFDSENFRWEKDAVKLAETIYRQRDCTIQRYLWKGQQWLIRSESAGGKKSCRLFIPSEFGDTFCAQGKWLNYFALERMLLPFDRLILHASYVRYQGKAILFSAPSGGGKSTQASLWEKYFNAEIINGDKAVISVDASGCIAYGSPVAGSSGIYKNIGASVSAIVILQKSSNNHMRPMAAREAYLAIYGQCVKSSWDQEYNCKLLEVIERLLEKIPVYLLGCTPDEGAAIYTKNYLEAKECFNECS